MSSSSMLRSSSNVWNKYCRPAKANYNIRIAFIQQSKIRTWGERVDARLKRKVPAKEGSQNSKSACSAGDGVPSGNTHLELSSVRPMGKIG